MAENRKNNSRGITTKGNTTLNSAKYSAENTDEWYTTYETISEEIAHYEDSFYGKTVLCNCDDPYESNFCYYFLRNFNRLGLKKLICTSYAGSKIDQIKDNVQLSLNLFFDDGNPVMIGSILNFSFTFAISAFSQGYWAMRSASFVSFVISILSSFAAATV